MNTYRIRLVGEPMGDWHVVEHYSPQYAVANVAGCDPKVVALSINSPRPGAWRYMPLDNSGRQWEVEDARVVEIHRDLVQGIELAGNCTMAYCDAKDLAVRDLQRIWRWRGSAIDAWRMVDDWARAAKKDREGRRA